MEKQSWGSNPTNNSLIKITNNVAYKVDIDVQANPENDYFLKCERVFSDQGKLNPIMLFGGKSFFKP